MKGAPKGFATYISSIHLQMLLALDRALAIIQVRGVGGANAHVTLMEK
jgi:hypothetical protein